MSLWQVRFQPRLSFLGLRRFFGLDGLIKPVLIFDAAPFMDYTHIQVMDEREPEL